MHSVVHDAVLVEGKFVSELYTGLWLVSEHATDESVSVPGLFEDCCCNLFDRALWKKVCC